MGLPGQKKIPAASGTAGMKAEASCFLQSVTMTTMAFSVMFIRQYMQEHSIHAPKVHSPLAQNPKKIPNAVQSCQLMTNAPRIAAGEFSAAKMGTVTPFAPMPNPRMSLTTKRVCHEWVKAEPRGVAKSTMAVMKMVLRRPR